MHTEEQSITPPFVDQPDRPSRWARLGLPAYFFTEAGHLLRLGMPMVATQLFIMGMGFTDTVMAGRYGTTALAGVTLGGNVLWPAFMFTSGLTMALTPMVAQLRGAGRTYRAGEKIRQGLWVALACGILLVVVLLSVPPLYAWLEVDAEVMGIAINYLLACAFGVVPAMIYISLRHATEGLGHTKPPMLIAAAALALNVPVNYLFIYGKLGMPELGGVGCGVATAVIFWFELALVLLVTRMPFFRTTGFWRHFSLPKLSVIKEIMLVGLPIGASNFVAMMVFSLIGFLIARIGVNELAAHSIAGNLNWLTYVIPMALGSAIGIRVGFATGAEDGTAIRQIIKTSLLVIGCYAVLVTALLVLCRHLMVSIYTTDQAVLAIAANLMLFVAFYQITDDLSAAFNGALRGFKDTFVPMVISLVNYWFISLPVGYLLAEGMVPGVPPLGVYGYWAAMSMGLALTATCVGIRLVSTTRKHLRRFQTDA